MMTSHGNEVRNYLVIGGWLSVLTVIEIGVIYMPLAKIVIGILLIGFALSKACIVAMFFMHLKFERPTLALIAFTPLMLCVLLIFALFPDLVMTPFKSVPIPQ